LLIPFYKAFDIFGEIGHGFLNIKQIFRKISIQCPKYFHEGKSNLYSTFPVGLPKIPGGERQVGPTSDFLY
jgi:hypothetical protein